MIFKMIKRRDFIRRSGTLALGSLLLPDLLKAIPSGKSDIQKGIGIQTFTLNTLMNADPVGTLKKLSAAGFKYIETASYTNGMFYGFKPKELKKIIDDLGMKWTGIHIPGLPFTELFEMPANPTPEMQKQLEQIKKMLSPDLPNLRDNTAMIVDMAAEAGLPYVVCASTAIKTRDQIKSAIDVFSKAGEACKKAGIQFAYHNHATEWADVGGTTAYDMILSGTKKELVKMELDLGWVATAGKNPVDLFKGNPGRFPLFHLKDFDLATGTMKPVGLGTIDFKPAFENADLAGMKYFFIEQDNAAGIDDVILGLNGVKKFL
jgi:sugar phosphate isomerase/epimerase